MPLVIATDIGEVKHVSKVVAEYVNESLAFFQIPFRASNTCCLMVHFRAKCSPLDAKDKPFQDMALKSLCLADA